MKQFEIVDGAIHRDGVALQPGQIVRALQQAERDKEHLRMNIDYWKEELLKVRVELSAERALTSRLLDRLDGRGNAKP